MRRLVSCLALIAAIGVSGCYFRLTGSNSDALKLATAMHTRMAQGDLAGIYNTADDGYRKAITREKSDGLFSAVARKLGTPQDCKQGNTNLQVPTWGTTLTSVCQTRFSKNATAVETFTWAKSGDQYRLLGYHINSDDLMER